MIPWLDHALIAGTSAVVVGYIYLWIILSVRKRKLDQIHAERMRQIAADHPVFLARLEYLNKATTTIYTSRAKGNEMTKMQADQYDPLVLQALLADLEQGDEQRVQYWLLNPLSLSPQVILSPIIFSDQGMKIR